MTPEPAPVEPTPVEQPGLTERATLFAVLTGGWIAQACYAIAKLGVPDLLADGPRTADDLAAACGADPRALNRTLRALSASDLLRETAPRTYALTATTRLLCSDYRRSSRPTALMFGEEVHGAFGEIMHTLRTGRPAFEQLHDIPFYDYLGEHPQAAETFHTAMGAAAVPAALATCDLGRLGTLVDIGGGEGGLLAKVLARHREARGVLVELPETLGLARARLTEAGCADRVDFVAGSFFDPDTVPRGADVYTLSRVLHNWDDVGAATILRRVREAMPPEGRLLVFEYLEDVQPAPTTRPARPYSAQAKLIDLLMLVMVDGHDRTLEQYRSLLADAGFAISSVHPAPVHASRTESVIEAVPLD
ncbi:cyclopropane fatty-acyl-phospholipid synthase-like methyltransferase [Kitasatospora sp. MAP12-15]|uniref:methyltransferase n=1 Tax=unclassified Kitasatospora TaxID=2633591 RepID=UPI002475A7F3|nr:methyltransferase [Kitasatospora sp. MAP12-44]MDH6109419.1 cyclopropane fatty-acyl-phospholipid synthase-like methyltransferase [Kitasatospora sp. MAP12-44]